MPSPPDINGPTTLGYRIRTTVIRKIEPGGANHNKLLPNNQTTMTIFNNPSHSIRAGRIGPFTVQLFKFLLLLKKRQQNGPACIAT